LRAPCRGKNSQSAVPPQIKRSFAPKVKKQGKASDHPAEAVMMGRTYRGRTRARALRGCCFVAKRALGRDHLRHEIRRGKKPREVSGLPDAQVNCWDLERRPVAGIVGKCNTAVLQNGEEGGREGAKKLAKNASGK